MEKLFPVRIWNSWPVDAFISFWYPPKSRAIAFSRIIGHKSLSDLKITYFCDSKIKNWSFNLLEPVYSRLHTSIHNYRIAKLLILCHYLSKNSMYFRTNELTIFSLSMQEFWLSYESYSSCIYCTIILKLVKIFQWKYCSLFCLNQKDNSIFYYLFLLNFKVSLTQSSICITYVQIYSFIFKFRDRTTRLKFVLCKVFEYGFY